MFLKPGDLLLYDILIREQVVKEKTVEISQTPFSLKHLKSQVSLFPFQILEMSPSGMNGLLMGFYLKVPTWSCSIFVQDASKLLKWSTQDKGAWPP